jgi:hypothetical protein
MLAALAMLLLGLVAPAAADPGIDSPDDANRLIGAF